MGEGKNSTRTQVMIIGAGPTGLSMAAQLIRYNIDFIILEKREGPTALSKAIAVQARSLEIFQELGLAEKAINEGRITTALNLFYRGRKRLHINIERLGEGISEFPFALSLEQSKTEKLLADYLTAHEKSIHWKTELTSFEQNDKTVVAYYKNNTGEEYKAVADYLVGCDGADSKVREQLGLSFQGSTEPKLFYVADVTLKSPVINKNVLYMFMIEKGFVLFFPMKSTGHYRMVGTLPEAKSDEQKNDEDNYDFSDVEKLVKNKLVTPVDIEKLHWFSTYKIHTRMADRFLKGRCFIAGDAAHIHTPAGGQGMNTGIQDAYNLAWKMAYTLRGEMTSELLETYSTERTRNARHLLKTTDRVFDVMAGVNGFWHFLRLHVFPAFLNLITRITWVRKQIFPLLSQTSIAYPDSTLTLKSAVGKVKSGERIDYFTFSDGSSIFSHLTHPAFKLLFFGDQENNESDNWIGAKRNVIAHHFQEIPEAVFGKEKNFYILLRPDNHISYIGKDRRSCQELLDTFSMVYEDDPQ